MQNIKLEIAYDGAAYLGWQDVKNGPNVEAEIKKALEQILQEEIHLEAASRTDRGVHALGQVASFHCKKKPKLCALKKSLNALLNEDIRIKRAEFVAASFHPTKDCKNKEYHYYLSYDDFVMPTKRAVYWHYPYSLDIALMQKEAKAFLGEKDFSAFCNQPQKDLYPHCIRSIERLEIIELGNKRLRFEIVGPNFLFRMVRNIVGYLACVGSNRLPDNHLFAILQSKDRKNAGVTAPPHGLFLAAVNY